MSHSGFCCQPSVGVRYIRFAGRGGQISSFYWLSLKEMFHLVHMHAYIIVLHYQTRFNLVHVWDLAAQWSVQVLGFHCSFVQTRGNIFFFFLVCGSTEWYLSCFFSSRNTFSSHHSSYRRLLFQKLQIFTNQIFWFKFSVSICTSCHGMSRDLNAKNVFPFKFSEICFIETSHANIDIFWEWFERIFFSPKFTFPLLVF